MIRNETELIHPKENVLYGFCLVVSIIFAIYLFISIIGVLIFAFFAVVSLFSHALSMAHIRLNGVRLRSSQLPELYAKVKSLCEKMELKQMPEVYIIESGGLLNAFATKILAVTGKNMVVLYSDFVDISLDSNEAVIDYVIAHELAHIKRNHVVKNIWILPAMWIPFLGASYSRMCEYTCDRMATYYTNLPKDSIQGLLVLAAGRKLYKEVNIEGYLQQYNENKGFFATLAELLSTHPPIPKRIEAIEAFMFDKPSVTLLGRKKQSAFILLITFIVIPVIFIGFFLAVEKVFENMPFSEFASFEDEWTPLMEASFNGDVDKTRELLTEGADPNETNQFGETALSMAGYSDIGIVQLLLEHGADPNIQDDYGWSPLMSAVTVENIEVAALLLEAGADPALLDEEGKSALDYADEYNNEEMLEMLMSYSD
jgi:Zn-dependent protease with chaperone function